MVALDGEPVFCIHRPKSEDVLCGRANHSRTVAGSGHQFHHAENVPDLFTQMHQTETREEAMDPCVGSRSQGGFSNVVFPPPFGPMIPT